MAETIEIKQEETTSEKPVEGNVTQSKPEGLPEKFNSVEDLAKSYSELEKKLGDNTEAPKTETKNDLDIAEKAVESAGLNMETLSSEYAEKGELDAKSYDALEKAGIPKDYVNQFIEGQKAMADQQATSIKDMVGGAEAYTEMSTWAADNMSEEEKTAYNSAVNSKDVETAKLAVVGLKAKFENANGNEPSLVEGKATVTGQGGYKSWAEVTAAMGDDRYSKDPAYQSMVQEKLANSDL
jgi:hypothetical protein